MLLWHVLFQVSWVRWVIFLHSVLEGKPSLVCDFKEFYRYLPTLEVRIRDILRDELEKAGHDLVHCRFLLTHLPEPEKALKRMADAMRPGLLKGTDW